MDAFLKAILKPSEQDTFDHLTRMEPPSLNTFRSPCTGKGCSGGAPIRGDGQVLLAGDRAGMDGWMDGGCSVCTSSIGISLRLVSCLGFLISQLKYPLGWN